MSCFYGIFDHSNHIFFHRCKYNARYHIQYFDLITKPNLYIIKHCIKMHLNQFILMKEISQNIDSDVYMLSTYGKNTNRIWHYLKCFCCFGKKFTYYNLSRMFKNNSNIPKLLLIYLLGNSTMISEEAFGTFDNLLSGLRRNLSLRCILLCGNMPNTSSANQTTGVKSLLVQYILWLELE